MKLKNLLLEKRSNILSKWFDKIIESYPADSTNFIKNQKNRFSNPVGSRISEGIGGLFDVLLESSDPETIYSFLDEIIRMRAVQDFSPSQAVSFIFALKKVLRETMEKEIRELALFDELALLESRIDDLALLSFDVFVKCRERIYELKAEEVKRTTFRLLQRANLVCEVQEDLDADSVLTKKNIKG